MIDVVGSIENKFRIQRKRKWFPRKTRSLDMHICFLWTPLHLNRLLQWMAAVLCHAQFVHLDTHLLVGHSWWSKYILQDSIAASVAVARWTE